MPKKKRITKKKLKRKSVKKCITKKRQKKLTVKNTSQRKTGEKIVGIITHYFPRVSAGVVKLKAPLSLGDNIRIKGHTTDFTQVVTSMQINHLPIQKAKRGQEIGLLVNYRVRKNDIVYKI